MSQAKSASETIADCLVICLEMLSRVAEILPLGVGFLLGCASGHGKAVGLLRSSLLLGGERFPSAGLESSRQ